MKLVISPASTDLQFRATFTEPQLGLGRVVDDERHQLIRKILTSFDLRLNDVKFNNLTPSNDFIHFSKFYGVCFLDVSFGLEEILVVLRRTESETQLVDIATKVGYLIEARPLATQRFTIQEHFSTSDQLVEYLQSLNPHCPSSFKDKLSSVGVHYTLKESDHNLAIYVTALESLFIQKGLYLSLEFEFSPSKYDLPNALAVTKEQYRFILNGLDLEIKEG
jgi:hypothetical protein